MKNVTVERKIKADKDAVEKLYNIELVVEQLKPEDVEYYATCDMIVKVQGAVRSFLAKKTEKLPAWLKLEGNKITATVEPKGTRTIGEATLDKATEVFTKMNEEGKLYMLKKMFPDMDEEQLKALLPK